ncbi:MAG TPA: alkaline phosphatase family protein, partial [Euzebyales bacterium]|nr:alkaline phosphatase family protein [Euzebyales bacterium]
MSLGASTRPHDLIAVAPDPTAADDIVLADYGGAWIGAVLPDLLAGRTPAGLPGWVRDATPLVLLLIDGLGWRLYQRFGALMPALADFTGEVITSVVPSTTAAALPSLTTGRTPGEHGVLGDRMRVGGVVLNVLQWSVPDGPPPVPASVQPHVPFAGRPVPVVTNAKFAGSGFSEAHLRGAPFHGYADAGELVGRVGEAIRAGAPVVYAYFPDADRMAHEHGFDHDAFAAALTAADAVVAGIRRHVPGGGALVVTADHGHVMVDPARRVDLTPLAPLIGAMSGSARLRYLHARPGAARELLAAARELAGQHAWVLDRGELVASGWLGPSTSPMIAGRVGDVVLAARDAVTLVDPAEGRLNELVTVHGSITADEMLVPLLVARG